MTPQVPQMFICPSIHVWEEMIFSKLTPQEYTRFGETCKYMNNKVNNSQVIWKAFFLYYNLGLEPKNVVDWKSRVIRQELRKRNLRANNVVEKIVHSTTSFGHGPFLCGNSIYATETNGQPAALESAKFVRCFFSSKPEVLLDYSYGGWLISLKPINENFSLLVTIPPGSREETVHIRNGETLTFSRACFAFHIYQDLIFLMCETGTIEIWNYKTNTFVEKVTNPFPDSCGFLGIQNNFIILYGKLEIVYIFDYKRPSETMKIVQNDNASHYLDLKFVYPVISFKSQQNLPARHFSCLTGGEIRDLSSHFDDTCDYVIRNGELLRRCLNTREILSKLSVSTNTHISFLTENALCLQMDTVYTVVNKETLETLDFFYGTRDSKLDIVDGLYVFQRYSHYLKRYEYSFFDIRKDRFLNRKGYKEIYQQGTYETSPLSYCCVRADYDKKYASLLSFVEPLPKREETSWVSSLIRSVTLKPTMQHI